MARTVTYATIRARIYQRANAQDHTTFVPDGTEMTDVAIESVAECWDEFVLATLPERMAKEVTVSTVNGTVAYSLPSDFLTLIAVWVDEGNGERRPIRGINDQERQAYRPPGAAYPVILKYIPVVPPPTGDVPSFDGVDGFEEFVVLVGAIKVLTKEGSNLPLLQLLISERERQRARIGRSYHANRGEPERVSRRAYRYTYPFPYTYRLSASTIHAYQLQGSNINLFQFAGATVP